MPARTVTFFGLFRLLQRVGGLSGAVKEVLILIQACHLEKHITLLKGSENLRLPKSPLQHAHKSQHVSIL